MSITCAICGETFKNLITSTHLKKHNVKTKEYKEAFGAVSSIEFRSLISSKNQGSSNPNFGNTMSAASKHQISEANKGKVPHNKGKECPLHVKAAVGNANKGHTYNQGRKHTSETKHKIKIARSTQVITSDSIAKAIETKRKNGYDFATFRGRHHTDESKKKISERSIALNSQKTEDAINAAAVRITPDGYSIVTVDGRFAQIECSKGHQFNVSRQCLTASKYSRTLCPSCHPREIVASKAEREISNFLAGVVTAVCNTRTVIPPLELDIFLPDYNVAIEFNGLYWHSEKFHDSLYHKRKMDECTSKGVKLVQIFEDEWVHSPDIVKSRLLSIIGHNKKIYGRQCEIVQLSSKEVSEFFSANHLQGNGRSNVRYGLTYNGVLVAAMTFLNGDVSKKVTSWELNRFASVTGSNVIGGASKLLTRFIKDHNPDSITTFADMRWSSQSTFYTAIGFKLSHVSTPGYWYVKPNETKRIHRFALRKPANCPVTEQELRASEGYLRIYDCGQAVYVWQK